MKRITGRICSAAISAAMCCCVFTSAVGTRITASSAESTYENLTYKVFYDNTIEISGCTDDAASIEIPSEIDGMTVTGIEYGAFENCTSLVSVTIPESVVNIDSFAFYQCTSLENVIIPSSVEYIGCFAFAYTPWLEAKADENPLVTINNILIDGSQCSGDVIIPDGVTSIADSAFGAAMEVTSVTIPASVQSIESLSFNYCLSLTAINASPDSEYFSSENGVLFNKTKTDLIRYPEGNTASSYTIPEGVTAISDSAFTTCENLVSVVMPDSVTEMGGLAFNGCSSLESVTLSDNIDTINGFAFSDCTSLREIVLDENITAIRIYAFDGCDNLESITIKNPDCDIYSDASTIPASAVIHGYSGSTAEAYASSFGCQFTVIGDAPAADVRGDADSNGQITLDDAVVILTAYAQKAASLITGEFTADEMNRMDTDGDGAVALADASAVLAYYAQTCAGMNPTWADILNV